MVRESDLQPEVAHSIQLVSLWLREISAALWATAEPREVL